MSASNNQARQRIAGLDTIRLVCALFVVFFHNGGPPIFEGLSRSTPTGRLVLGLYDAAFNGQAGVIAFFVISGFCIHLPYAGGRRFAAGPFLLGRAVRILIPTVAYLLLLRWLGAWRQGFVLMLWSVWCEIIYYVLYPGLRRVFARISIAIVLTVAYVAAAIDASFLAFGPNWQALFGDGRWAWLAGLPCWLLGCLLAERVARSTSPPTIALWTVWGFRLGAWGLAVASYLAMFHFHLSFLVSLQVFAVFAYFWLDAEVRWFRTHSANRFLEWLGGMTFSIYLVHQLAGFLWVRFRPVSGLLSWSSELVFVLLASTVFYLLIEAPSHRLARFLSRRGRQHAPATLITEDANPAA